MQNNANTLEAYSIRGAGSEGAITVLGEQDAFFRNRGTPKYIEDAFASGGVALTGSTATVPITVDGYNVFVVSLEGSIALGSVVLQAQTRIGINSVWENIATIVAGAPPVTLSFFRRRIRFVYTFGAGDAITYLSVYAVRDSAPTSVGGSAAPVSISPSSTATVTSVSDSATSVILLGSNASRKGAIIYNDSSSNLYVKFGPTASITSFTALLLGNGSGTGGYYEVPASYTGRIDGIWTVAAGGNARITELT